MNNITRDWNSLPDEILLHILSFLNTKQAVQSISISKRWSNLWTSLPNLDFDYRFFGKMTRFDEFIDKVLTIQDESAVVKSLIFNRKRRPKSELLKRVMSYAATHGVQHLNIYTYIVYDLCWLCSIDTLLTLKLRKLNSNIRYIYPKENTCFRQLVTLHLEQAQFVTSDPFSGCPNLENLTLINCYVEYYSRLKVLVLSGTRLLKLTIASKWYSDIDCELVLMSSRLMFLKIEGNQPLDVLFQSNDGLPQFNEVYFDSDSAKEGYLSNERKQILHSYLTKMLRSLHKAKYVTVSVTTAEILGYDPVMLAQEEFPFCNLKSLTLIPSNYRRDKPFKVPACVMDYFLRSSPQAEVNIQYPSCKSCKLR